MNTTINTFQENSTIVICESSAESNALLSFTSSIYDKIDITSVITITGTSNSIIDIIESGDFIGISSQSLILTDSNIENSTISYFEGKGFTII